MSVINSSLFIRLRLVVPILVMITSFSAIAVTKAFPTGNLRLGLYKVTDRICYNPIELSDVCPSTQYIELVKGRFYGVSPTQVAMVMWMAPKPESEDYTYSAGPLRGRFVKPNEYLINETPETNEWFVVSSGGVIHEHWYVRFDSDARKKVIKKTHLTLKPISRDAKINRLLEYPPPD